jgi:hypothetical protein
MAAKDGEARRGENRASVLSVLKTMSFSPQRNY